MKFTAWPQTLYAKLALGLTALLAVTGLVYVLISNAATDRYLQQVNQQLHRNLAQNIIADRKLVAQGRLDEGALKRTFDLYMEINPSIEIYLLDRNGAIMSYSADPKKIKRNRVSLEPIKAFLAMERPYPLLGDDPRSHDRQKAFSVTPVPNAENPTGYLYVVLRGEQFDFAERMARQGFVNRASALAVALSLIVALIAGLIVFRLLTARLGRLAGEVERFSQSGFTSALKLGRHPKPGDEIDRLGATFARMARHIRAQLKRLKSEDRLRRRLVAQISHDLRTPLAAMQGYLDTLAMKGKQLSAREREKFLGVALAQTRQLSGLVEELFELANLDARERQPDLMPFPLVDLAHDVAQKYALRADQAGVELTIEHGENPGLALGDIGLTERVFDNLIDNALRFTPKGGRVEISLKRARGKIACAISNSGPAIPKPELDHLFEPFYQGESADAAVKPNPANPRRHGGLGLAIAKRALALQDGDISAASPPGRPVTFTFRLPQATSARIARNKPSGKGKPRRG